MSREPSIHITKSTFKGIFQEVTGRSLGDKFIDEFFSLARKSSCDHRSVIQGNKQTQEKAEKRVQSTIGDANMLADIIYATRVKLKHVGVSKIKQTDLQWAQVKQLVPVVNQFCDNYQFDIRQGYIEFITIGLKLMGKTKRVNYNFCASWLFQRADWIIDVYESSAEINNDSSPAYTKSLYNAYCKEILDRVGIADKYTDNPQEYVCFVRARVLADEMGVDYETFILAQFYALEFCSGIPKIEDLSGDKARQRVIQYMSKFNIVSRPKIDHTDWDNFKK